MEHGGAAYSALVVWLSTFAEKEQDAGEEDGCPFEEARLHDGRFLHNRVGIALSPDLFDAAAVKGADASRQNWMLRRGNLKKFANGLRLYIEGFLGGDEQNYACEDFLAEIDLTKIAKDEGPPFADGGDVELAKLCQLALAELHRRDFEGVAVFDPNGKFLGLKRWYSCNDDDDDYAELRKEVAVKELALPSWPQVSSEAARVELQAKVRAVVADFVQVGSRRACDRCGPPRLCPARGAAEREGAGSVHGVRCR